MVKKLIILLIVFFFISGPLTSVQTIPAASEDTTVLSYRFEFDSPGIFQRIKDNALIKYIRMNDTELLQSEGKPVIPVKPIQILLPYQTTLDSISLEVSDSFTQVTDLRQLELGSSSRSFSQMPGSTEEFISPQFDQKTLFPETVYEQIGIQQLHGCSILYINLFPIQVHYDDNLIRTNHNIDLYIKVKPLNTDVEPVLTFERIDQITSRVINKEIMKTYPQQSTSFSNGDPVIIDYLLITTENLSNLTDPLTYTFDDLIAHRQSQGLSCALLTVEEIKDSYTGVDVQEQIRNAIKDYYQTHLTSWVLLGGDIEYVPARYLVSVDGGNQNEPNITSDLYYQCLDGNYNWDNDEDWGEQYDGEQGNRIDLLAEVYIGRAPVDDAVDINAFVEKTLSYEQYDWEDPWTHRVLSSGEKLWDGNGGYGAGYVELCIDYQTIYDHETYGIPSDHYEIIELYERDAPWNEDDVIIQVDQGISIINHVGHGNPAKAMKFSHFELAYLNNTDRYGLFYSQACHSGQFEYFDDCFAERWVNIPKKGGFAAIMNTGYGYGSSWDYDGPDNRYAREFYDALFSPHEKISRIGHALQDSKEDNIWRLSDKYMYHVYYCKTLFGDPYVSIIGSESVSAQFSWDPSYPVTGNVISFHDESSGIITYRQWDFGDGFVSQEENPIHVYGSKGRYTVTLTVQDQFGYLSTYSQVIDVRDYWNPRSIITPDYYQGGNFTVHLSGNKSFDPDGSIVSYYWDFDDGSTADTQQVTHTFQQEGTYVVELTVTDNEGNVAKNSSKIILLYQSPPDPPIIHQAPSFVNTGETFQIEVQTTDLEYDVVQYGIKWDMDSSIEWSQEWYDVNQSAVFTHTYAMIGDHEIRVKARDIHYAESPWSDPLTVTVEDNQDPGLVILSPVNGIYLKDSYLIPFFSPVIFGPITIAVNATDPSGIEKVMFYVDDPIHPKAEVLSPPYRFIYEETSFSKHDIIIKVFDNAGRISEEQQIIWKFF